jgi:cytoskeletal protein RodZ
MKHNMHTKVAEKIAEMRRQPEHVRMRYVWISVTVCMVIIFAIWIFSITAMFQAQKNTPAQDGSGASSITNQLHDLKTQAPSLKNYADQSLPVGNEGVTAPAQGNSDFQYPASATNSEAPQASSYSDLPATTPAQ